MSSYGELSARSDQATVCVEHSVRGGWTVLAPGRAGPITCETLEDAERLGHLSLARTHARELIVRDAYHRVLHHERVGRDRAARVGN
jgi:hypothetical protein